MNMKVTNQANVFDIMHIKDIVTLYMHIVLVLQASILLFWYHAYLSSRPMYAVS